MDIDPDRLKAVIGALGGAMIFGLVQFGAVALSGHAPTRDEYRALSLNVACAIVAGTILAGFWVKIATPMIPFAPLRDASAFGFAVGAFGWELLPLVFKVLRNRGRRQVAQIAGEEP